MQFFGVLDRLFARRNIRMIDKKHSDYEKYKKEFWQIAEQEEKEREKVKKSRLRGNDSQRDVIHKKYVAMIKALQEKYWYLFLDD